MKARKIIVGIFSASRNKVYLLTACAMYVVKWESSIIDLRIWDKSTLFLEAEKIPAIIFRAYILTEAQPRSIRRGK